MRNDPRPSARAHAAPHAPDVREAKIRASLLLKFLRSGDPDIAHAAARRLRVVPAFAALTPDAVVARAGDVKRKHALAAVAHEMGFAAWDELVQAAERAADRATDPRSVEWLIDRDRGVSLNVWCKTYDEAAAVRAESDGFLFAYREHFVVCAAGLLEYHELEPNHDDWNAIGRDWVKPRDARAFERLVARVAAARPSPARPAP